MSSQPEDKVREEMSRYDYFALLSTCGESRDCVLVPISISAKPKEVMFLKGVSATSPLEYPAEIIVEALVGGEASTPEQKIWYLQFSRILIADNPEVTSPHHRVPSQCSARFDSG